MQTDLGIEKAKCANLEQKFSYSESKCHLMIQELSDKTKTINKLQDEISELKTSVDLYDYKLSNSDKDLASNKLKMEKIEEEMKHLRSLHAHYKQAYEQSSVSLKQVEERLLEANTMLEKQVNELSFYKREYSGFEEIKKGKETRIEELKEINQ